MVLNRIKHELGWYHVRSASYSLNEQNINNVVDNIMLLFSDKGILLIEAIMPPAHYSKFVEHSTLHFLCLNSSRI